MVSLRGRALVQHLIAESGIEMKALSLRIRPKAKSGTYIHQYLTYHKPWELKERDREGLANFFGRNADDFREEPPPGRSDLCPLDAGREPVMIYGSEFSLIAVYDLCLSAGPGAYSEADGEPLYWEPHRTHWLRQLTSTPPHNLVIGVVEGDSMAPTLLPGDQVLIDRGRPALSHDGIYAFRIGDSLQVKRFSIDPRTRRVTIISDNKSYPPYPRLDPADLAVIGRVIWLGRRV